MAAVLVQTENRPSTTNGTHVVSNFTQRRQRDFQQIRRHIQNCASAFPFEPMFFEAKSKKTRQNK